MTDIIDAANDPLVGGLSTLTDNVLEIDLVVGALPLIGDIFGPGDTLIITDLDAEIDDILAEIAAGEQIGLTVLDTDGNLIAPGSDCNITADALTLDQEAGIAIGGNQITGLGENGIAASAGEINAIAFGNNASTAVGATGAIAIGEGASVTATGINSVALGAGSVADRGPLSAYAAPGLAGTFDSVGTVSVGSPGALRQITNLAPGTEATDAATVGQVQAALDAIDVIDTTLEDVVAYDDATQTSVTLGGAGGTTVTNVADATLSAGSSDAVNGSQLFATNQQVDANAVAIQANADAIAAIDFTGDPLGVTYDDATRTFITLDGAGGTTIANVADGELSATSDEAVNGSQLFATNQQFDANTGDIADLDGRVSLVEGDIGQVDARVTINEGDIANLDTAVTTNTTQIANIDDRVTVNEGNITNIQAQLDNVPVTYVADADPTMPSTTQTNTVAFVGATADPVVVANVAAGNVAAGSTDAVNGAQLAATNATVADNRTDIDQNTADIVAINNNLSGSTVVAVQYSDPGDPTVSNGGTITNDVTLVGADAAQPVALHNVAAGTAATDAVNLGQLQAGMADVLTDSMTYTDQQFGLLSAQINDIAFDLEDVRDEAFAGTAGAMAVAGIPQTMEPGRAMVGGAVGHYRGETAFAIGASTTFNEGRGVLKAGATLDTNGRGSFSAGAGFSF